MIASICTDCLAARQSVEVHWIPRDVVGLNKFCHEAANAARRTEQHKLADKVLAQLGVTGLAELTPLGANPVQEYKNNSAPPGDDKQRKSLPAVAKSDKPLRILTGGRRRAALAS